MKVPSVPIEVWKNLYEAALIFRDTECWDWMSDSDIFGVQNPENGEIGYCCVLGKLGEVFGLVVYLGTDGLEQYSRIQSEEIAPNDDEALFAQNCLKVSFEDRGQLQEPDLQVIKRLGLKLRGRNAWPEFRRLQPGYYPWYLTESEAKYLNLALRQAKEVAVQFKKEPVWLTPASKGQYLVRAPIKQTDGVAWKSQWLQPPPITREEIRTEPIDEVRLQRMRKTIHQHHGIWEADFFNTPMPVQGEDRPFFPLTLLCTDHESGFILGIVAVEPSQWGPEFPKEVLHWIENHRLLPNELWVRKKEALDILKPLTSHLGIKVRLTKRLAAIEQARASLLEFISKGRKQRKR